MECFWRPCTTRALFYFYLLIGILQQTAKSYICFIKQEPAKRFINTMKEDIDVNENFWGIKPYFFKGVRVTVNCGDKGKIKGAIVIGFHSYGDKHKYDVEIKFSIVLDGFPVEDVTRLYNVDARLLDLE